MGWGRKGKLDSHSHNRIHQLVPILREQRGNREGTEGTSANVGTSAHFKDGRGFLQRSSASTDFREDWQKRAVHFSVYWSLKPHISTHLFGLSVSSNQTLSGKRKQWITLKESEGLLPSGGHTEELQLHIQIKLYTQLHKNITVIIKASVRACNHGHQSVTARATTRLHSYTHNRKCVTQSDICVYNIYNMHKV